MRLSYAEQLDENVLIESKYDLIIVASGYESRCTHLVETLELESSTRVYLSFIELESHPQHIENNAIFEAQGYEKHRLGGGDYVGLIGILNSVIGDLQLFNKECLNVLVDYSCMTKVWYATIINYFKNKDSQSRNIAVSFSYTPSEYSEPMDPMPNAFMGPIPGIFRVSAASKPTALIIGLGYELDRARGIAQYLDPNKIFAFYSKPAFSPDFEETVESHNDKFLASLPDGHVYRYPVMDLKIIDDKLTSLCNRLRTSYRVVLAPLGPKPFALMCLLLAARYEDIDVWRVTAGARGNVYDRKAAKIPSVICKISFVSETEMID